MNSLQGEGLDALELMIIFNARSSSFSWNRQIELSSSLTERLSKYFTDELRYRISMEGVDEPLLANGAKTIVPEGSICRMDFFGLLNSTVEVLKGEVGVLDGEIFVKDGTIAMIDSVKYQYANNLWLLAEN
ncbi:MAG: hypothetical protein JXP36_11470 [Bacteroidales bacterium]|nr:hypothetical protein [Bacteroidales bacterium]